MGHDWPDQAAAWGQLPFPPPDDYKYLDVLKVDLAQIRTTKALSSIDLQEKVARNPEGHALGGP
eukprot:14131632-Alexandrium_andersonii.AAC.1